MPSLNLPSKFDNFEQVVSLFQSLSSPTNVDVVGGVLIPDTAIAKQTKFLELAGSPHLKIKMIHIAGTSGKGSTTTILANGLVSQGFKVGSSISPHLTNLTERVQINGQPISETQFVEYANQILPAIHTMNQEGVCPSYFEVNTTLQFLAFADQKVDYAIMEVGMGGRLDATNVFVPNKICVINSIGLDHTQWLGDTVELIAGEKAGIIQQNNQVIALSQSQSINQVFVQKANTNKADLDFVVPELDFYSISQNANKLYFDYIDNDLNEQQIILGMLGQYQASNAALALRAIETVADRDEWEIDWSKLKNRLSTTKMLGRFDITEYNSKNIIIDGAHNPQKMDSFISSLSQYYPDTKFDFLIAFKAGKDYEEMINEILKIKSQINKIIVSEFTLHQDSKIHSQDSAKIFDYLKANGFENCESIQDLGQAIQTLKQSEYSGVITGSLYLIGNVYKLI
jgi:dihydrofolate synthase / folylpolyglutamate synthase